MNFSLKTQKCKQTAKKENKNKTMFVLHLTFEITKKITFVWKKVEFCFIKMCCFDKINEKIFCLQLVIMRWRNNARLDNKSDCEIIRVSLASAESIRYAFENWPWSHAAVGWNQMKTIPGDRNRPSRTNLARSASVTLPGHWPSIQRA